MATSNQENAGTSIFGYHQFQWLGLPAKSVMELAREAKKLGRDDPRRITHSLKAGLSLVLVSLFYHVDPLYSSFGDNTTWAVMTAVVIFEFSVGATLGKSVNRILATLGAGTLSLGVHGLANLFGNTGEPIVIDIFVFAVAAMVTFARFFPRFKARCDYGLLIFILTFSLLSVSSHREDKMVKMALERLSTIALGCCTTILVSICICPVWIGEDLHNLIALNIEKLENFLQGFGGEYCGVYQEGLPSNDRSFLQGYKSVLNSQSSEENMANLARWEPAHGRFRFFHPWKQYLKIGSLTRLCAIKIDVLNNYLNPQIQTPLEIRSEIKEQCMTISLECGKALKESSASIRRMIRADTAHLHIGNSKAAAENLKILFKTGLWKEADLLEIAPATTVASLLLEVVLCTERIVDAVQELASLAGFKSIESSGSIEQLQRSSQQIHSIDAQNHEITIGE
ncbi:hypothetical protein P3X46_010330 [Hevea brasiliensis]|uniref:Aluminum-activated malate transporter n=1 Tax=Hevea brasiliensis TaxID=3981 RepID=A0ABQ9MHK5_HEVBR|nr:aluminum-activated malate transporter 2-like [Hevea brasiliensis]KAJ9178450.1 hypothetical protein P3X46_010330 [Hevea brasiliensis]